MLWPRPNDIRACMQALMLWGWLYGPMPVGTAGVMGQNGSS